MIKKLGLLAVITALIAMLAPGPVQAVGGISIVLSSAQSQFPLTLTFNLQAQSSAPITDVRLHYAVERDSFVKVVSEIKPVFTVSASVNTSYAWDMRQSGGLPTGTVVDYWWTVSDSSGSSLSSEQQKVSFNDTRYTWRRLSGGNINLYWYSGDAAFAQGLLDTAQQGLAALEKNTGAELSKPVSVYIYNNANDMQGAMIFPQDWTGGATYPAYSTIVIGINGSNLAWGKGALVHELTHMVDYQMTDNPYSGLPTWLDEGLAMYSQGALDSSFLGFLTAAINQGTLISVRSLASPFSANAGLTYLEYAESYSLIDYLVSTYGQAKMLALLETFRQGSTYDDALLKVYGFDMDGLFSLWKPYAIQKYAPARAGATV